MARYMRTDLGKGHARLSPPAVVGAGIYYRGIQQYLTAVDRMAEQPRHFARYRLSPPQVVNPPVVFIADPVRVTLAPSSRGTPKSFLGPPVVDAFQGPQVTTVRIKPPPTTSRLSPPTVVFTAVELQGPEVQLARITPPPTSSRLSPPTVVFLAVEIYGPRVTLTRIKPQPTTTLLGVFPPQAVVHRPVLTHLAASSRGAPLSRLQPPAVVAAEAVFTAEPVRVTLSPSHGGVTQSRLAPPAVVGAGAAFHGPGVLLTYSRRGQPKPVLQPPAVVAPVLFFGPVTTLAPQRRGVPRPFLSPPAVVASPPAIVFGIKVTLAYSRRGKAKSKLRPPAVTGAGRAFGGPGTLLTYSRRGKPKSFRQRHVAGQRPHRGILVNLAVPKRGRAAYVTQVQSFLRPGLIGRAPFRGLLVTLAQNPPRSTLSLLKPPSVVGEPPPVAVGDLRIGGRRPNYRYPGQYDEEFEDLLALILASFYDSDEEEED